MLSLVCAHYITSLPRDWLELSSSAQHPPRASPSRIERGFKSTSSSLSSSSFFFFFSLLLWLNKSVRVGVRAFSSSWTGGSFRRWPRARQTRRARRLSLRVNTSSLMECGCRPSAEGRWRRSPTSPSEVATYGLSPTQSQVTKPQPRPAHGARCVSSPLFALCCSGDCTSPRWLSKFYGGNKIRRHAVLRIGFISPAIQVQQSVNLQDTSRLMGSSGPVILGGSELSNIWAYAALLQQSFYRPLGILEADSQPTIR